MISASDVPISWIGFSSKNLQCEVPKTILDNLPINEKLNQNSILSAINTVMNHEFLHKAVKYELKIDKSDFYYPQKKEYSKRFKEIYLKSPYIRYIPYLQLQKEYKDFIKYSLESNREEYVLSEENKNYFFKRNKFFSEPYMYEGSKCNLYCFHMEPDKRNVLLVTELDGKMVYTIPHRHSEDFLGIVTGKYLIINYLNNIEKALIA